MYAKGFDVMGAVEKIGHQRGPGPGEGRSSGTPWRGIVEETPAIWVSWVVGAARRAGYKTPDHLEVNGQRAHLVSVPLTYGPRWYFECPHCGRRCEALYLKGRDFGCRRCLRLGYRSQKYRATSCYAVLDLLFDRDSSRWLEGRYGAEKVQVMVSDLRKHLLGRIDALFDGAKVALEDTETGGTPTIPTGKDTNDG